MKIYHGSPMEIPKPLLSKGKPNNDYGRGFYCTEDIEMAREWACKGKEPSGFANAYELFVDELSILNLSAPGYTILNWIAVLLANRTFDLDSDIALEVRDYLIANFMPPVLESDVVIGYRADDSYFSYADSFVNNALSVRRLDEALHLGRLGEQVALRTERAFENLTYLGSERVSWEEYHPRYVARDSDARSQWRDTVKKGRRAADDIFAIDIIRRNLRHGDPILQ
jgi:hypothetical protein